MLKRFLPSAHVKSIFDITPEKLKEQGIEGVITDLDNTLVSWDTRTATPEVIEWFAKMKEQGIKVSVLSNNNKERVSFFCDPIGTPYVFSARKPLSKSFKRAAREMGIDKRKIAVIGDQLLTDVLGGNSAGFHTVLVVPIVQTDGRITRMNRMIERRILNYFRKKGLIDWEE
ncbi:YqeG family HAD IIIA-type phosphatase [Aciduricibacillus chroicocephali]|uniref:YqeG family HAD IIIA-type phosphatase n=1 Tax=Aciduricibacillus chroicocephali TaxID=3054939 RepID=A0ABY9KSU6_9BACI|nr:YqeG family HAD IIIA-type phosphatase [Bacillaceae bacterium 44XB]